MEQVLELESTNIKALYRRVQAYMELLDLDYAETDIKKALDLEPNNKEVKLEYKRLKQKQVEQNKKEAKFPLMKLKRRCSVGSISSNPWG